jgi:hypothetical protein
MALLLSQLHASVEPSAECAATASSASPRAEVVAALRAQSWQTRVEACVFLVLTEDLHRLVQEEPTSNTGAGVQDFLSRVVLLLQAYRAMLCSTGLTEDVCQKALALAQRLFANEDAEKSFVVPKGLDSIVDGAGKDILVFLQRMTGYSPAVLLSDPRVSPALSSPMPSQPSAAALRRVLCCNRMESRMHERALMEELQRYHESWPAFAADPTKCHRVFWGQARRITFPHLATIARRHCEIAVSYPDLFAFIQAPLDKVLAVNAEQDWSTYLSDIFMRTNAWLLEPVGLAPS